MGVRMSLDPTSLCLHINDEFSGMTYPGDDNIVRDNSGLHMECEEIKKALRNTHWRNVSFETLEQLSSALSFLSPEGYRFYLPAFMIFSIVDFSRADTIPYEVVRTLTLPNEFDIDKLRELAKLRPEIQPFSADEWETLLKMIAENYQSGTFERTFFDRISGFTVSQSKVIRQFLEYMGDVYRDEFPNREPDIAIERYWHQF